jgi:L,D-peptidoglycan transpeptidase YkuD (ErfK/YbiS/YcfS/YnhG family)
MKLEVIGVKRLYELIVLSVMIISLCGCGNIAGTNVPNEAQKDASTSTMLGESPEWIVNLPEAEYATQLFVVAGYEGTTAWVSLNEKDEAGNWNMIMTTPGYIGKAGLGKTKEGDGMTPVGTFAFNKAFGIAKDPGCQIPYTQVTDDIYWSGDQRDGMKYNEMVSIKDYPDLDKDNSEHIIDYTREYQYCLNIDYNRECIPGLGSAIFLHCLGPYKPYTGGCVAIPEDQMMVVMKNVRPDCVVVIDSLDNLGGGYMIRRQSVSLSASKEAR